MKLHYQTVSPVLVHCLHKLMTHPAFKVHELLESYSLSEMIDWGIQRYPWTVTCDSVKDGIERLPLIKDFTEVVCMKSKYWEFIVEDLLDEVKTI